MIEGSVYPITSEHPVRGHEPFAEILLGNHAMVLADSAQQLVLVPIFDNDGSLVGFHATPYPTDFEMKGDF